MGVISDTHGLLRPAAIEALRGCDRILHAGDVGSGEILPALRQIAPTVAVRGNVDAGNWADELAATEVAEVGPVSFYMLHIRELLDLDPAAAGFDAVVYGHSHRPEIDRRDGVLYLNPGSAGPRRFRLPVTLAIVEVDAEQVRPRIVDLESGAAHAGG